MIKSDLANGLLWKLLLYTVMIKVFYLHAHPQPAHILVYISPKLIPNIILCLLSSLA